MGLRINNILIKNLKKNQKKNQKPKQTIFVSYHYSMAH